MSEQTTKLFHERLTTGTKHKNKKQKRNLDMTFGLGSTKKVQKDKKTSKKKSSSQADEAAEMLKKMEEKKAAGDCPFC